MSVLVEGDYHLTGFARVVRLVAPEVAKALLAQLWQDVGKLRLPVSMVAREGILKNKAMELHGSHYTPLVTFLWGLTPAMSLLTGCELLPTYCFFRLYTKGDALAVHRDRDACEHSLSLTLGYANDLVWPLEVGRKGAHLENAATTGGKVEQLASFNLGCGDALLYRGIECRHGRTTENPNDWSAHLFLHWVDRDGPHRGLAFEKEPKGHGD